MFFTLRIVDAFHRVAYCGSIVLRLNSSFSTLSNILVRDICYEAMCHDVTVDASSRYIQIWIHRGCLRSGEREPYSEN